MLEARVGETVLEDVNEVTFYHFCQFAYTGNYESPPFTQPQESVLSNNSSTEESLATEDKPEPTATNDEDMTTPVAEPIPTVDELVEAPADAPTEAFVFESVEIHGDHGQHLTDTRRRKDSE